MRKMILASVVAIGGLGAVGTPTANAQWLGSGGSYYGGGYGVPSFNYYGQGGHDFVPHWHNTYTPFGRFSWYGMGSHDFRPHEHTVSPYGGYRGYSYSPFGVTESIYPSTPYLFMPW